MQPLSCLFIVQGVGCGHLTQALALRAILRRAGHHVCGVLVGRGADRDVPGFFREKFDAPLSCFDSAHFAVDGATRSIRWLPSLVNNIRRSRLLRASLTTIDAHIRLHQPDVVINFYEPMVGLYYLTHRPSTTMVAVAHQYMFMHPRYPFPHSFRLQRHATTLFTRLTAVGAARKLALSLYDAPHLPTIHADPRARRFRPLHDGLPDRAALETVWNLDQPASERRSQVAFVTTFEDRSSATDRESGTKDAATRAEGD